jgi:hypothetical protein
MKKLDLRSKPILTTAERNQMVYEYGPLKMDFIPETEIMPKITKLTDQKGVCSSHIMVQDLFEWQYGRAMGELPEVELTPGEKFDISIFTEGEGWVSLTSDKEEYEPGETVTLTANLEEGYEVDTITVSWNKGNVKVLKSEERNEWKFVMPSGVASVDALARVEGGSSEKTALNPESFKFDSSREHYNYTGYEVMSPEFVSQTEVILSHNLNCYPEVMVIATVEGELHKYEVQVSYLSLTRIKVVSNENIPSGAKFILR